MDSFKITKYRDKMLRSALDKQQIFAGTRIFVDFSVSRNVSVITTTQLPDITRILKLNSFLGNFSFQNAFRTKTNGKTFTK
jgi:hypothetical protein